MSAFTTISMQQFSQSLDEQFVALQFSGGQRLSLYRRLLSLLAYGVPLMRVMEQLLIAYEKRKLDKRVSARVLSAVYDDMRQASGGVVFAEALSRWAPDAEIMLINAGERAGNIERGLEEAIFVNESLSRIRGAVIGAVAYPTVLLVILTGLYMLFALMILPKIESLLPLEQWPSWSQKMHAVLSFIRDDGLFLLAGLIALAIAVTWAMPRYTGQWRKYLDKVLPFSIYRVIAGSGLLVGLSAMLEAGVKMRDALVELKSNASPYMAVHIDTVLHRLSSGEPSGAALETGLFSEETSISLEIFGDSGSFESSMKVLGREAVESTVSWIKTMGQGLTTAGVVAIGCSLVFLLGGFYQLIQEVKNLAG